MHKKDFESIAYVLKLLNSSFTAKEKLRPFKASKVCEAHAIALSVLFARDNPSFNKEKFLAACGYSTNLTNKETDENNQT